MKTTLIFLLLLTFSNYAQSQTDSTKVKKDNLLDMQTNLFTGLFGENLDGNTSGKSIGYLEFLNKLDISEKQKIEMRNIYFLQAKNLTRQQKDSLGKVLERKILEAKRDQ